MTIKQMEYFVSVVECKSITKAAREHWIAQPAMTQQIKAMEKELGGTLLVRGTRSTQPTEFGQTIYCAFQQMLSIYQKASNAVNLQSFQHYELTVGSMGAEERELLPALILAFREKHPHSELDICFDNPAILRQKMDKEGLDIVFSCAIEEFEQSRFIKRKLKTISTQFQNAIIYAGHPLYHRDSISVCDLEDEDIIYYVAGDRSKSMRKLDGIFAAAQVTPGRIYHAQTSDSMILKVEAHIGIGFLMGGSPKYISLPDNLRLIPFKDSRVDSTLYAIWDRDNTNPALPKFLTVIDEHLK